MKKATKIIMQGTVQSMSFKQYVKEHADKLKLTGHARMKENGSIEILVEGEGEAIERLIGLLKQGPQHASIRNVNLEEKKWSGEYKDFKLLKF